LELRPRRLREAAALWWALTEAGGTTGRDAIWAHPDLLPDADDLSDPLGFAERATSNAASALEEEAFDGLATGGIASDELPVDQPHAETEDPGSATPPTTETGNPTDEGPDDSSNRGTTAS
jgi:hypothetical protein